MPKRKVESEIAKQSQVFAIQLADDVTRLRADLARVTEERDRLRAHPEQTGE